MKTIFLIIAILYGSTIAAHDLTISTRIQKTENRDGVIFTLQENTTHQRIINKDSLLFRTTFLNLQKGTKNTITSRSNWGRVNIERIKQTTLITFTEPKLENIPQNIKIIYSITTKGNRSSWKIEIKDIGKEHSLLALKTPVIQMPFLKDAKVLIPKYSGKLIDLSTNDINYRMLYPSGWQSTMQFFAYYNTDIGIYFACHDPKASTKRFHLKKGKNALIYFTDIIVPNKTLPNNDFSQSGNFELDLFRGDWYDAARIYRGWAKNKALFWPRLTPKKRAKEHIIGEIALWGACMPGAKRDIKKIEAWMKRFRKEFGDIGVGIMWLEWNRVKHDYDFPNFFPAKEGMKELVALMQTKYNSYIMPYINARLFDTGLPNFTKEGYPYALKDSNGKLFTYSPLGKKGDTFAVMDPTQKRWQDIIVDASKKLMIDIGTKGLYLDQITASSPKEDMDRNHLKEHPLGGGSWWREGYNEMLERIDEIAGDSRFLTSEGANEFVSNHIDGFYLHGWAIEGLVPAYQVVYGGRVQLFGIPYQTNEYNKPSFYAKTAKAFTSAIQIGPLPVSWFIQAPKAQKVALPYIKDIATLRYKLRDFLSYGQRQRDITLRGDIPIITSKWFDYGKYHNVSIKAVQSAVYKDENGKRLALIFSNASKDRSVEFEFDFSTKMYDLPDNIKIKIITSKGETPYKSIEHNFTKRVKLKPLQSFAYIIK